MIPPFNDGDYFHDGPEPAPGVASIAGDTKTAAILRLEKPIDLHDGKNEAIHRERAELKKP